MDEELNYVSVAFYTNVTSVSEKPSDQTIYDEVKPRHPHPHIPEKEKKPPLCSLLHLAAAGLGIICIILVSVVIAGVSHFNTVVSELHRDNVNLTAQNLQLWTRKSDLERQTAALTRERDGLTRERDGLSWTMDFILDYNYFPVIDYCPQKACQPCLEGWVLFQSNCYLFSTSNYHSYWRNWEQSQDHCRQKNADLVVIESQEEQEFINNHTEAYNDDRNGYWIGLRKTDTWTWVDGRNFTVTYWKTQQVGYRGSCALSQPRADPLANWQKESCDMKNRWICEKRTMIKPDQESAEFLK